MINVKELEEFQFLYGDPRPFFHDYLIGLPNIACYSPSQKYDIKTFTFACNKEVSKRRLKPPTSVKALKKLEDNIAGGDDPIIVVPVILKNKFPCRYNNLARHSNVIMYNRHTHEVERLDIKRYHLDGFSLKVFMKKLEEEFMTKIVSPHDQDPDLTLIIDVDVPLPFIEKHGFTQASEAYPAFLMTYVHMRSKFPKLISEKVVAKTLTLSSKQVTSIWQKYVAFRSSAGSAPCSEGLTENPESTKCMRPLSSAFNKVVMEKPPKECKQGYVYNSLLEKCVSADKNIHVNVLMSDVVPYSGAHANLPHVDAKVLDIMNFIMSRFPHAYFIYPRDSTKTKNPKTSYSIKWQYNEETKNFDLKMPPNYWDMWQQPMTTPSIRFIISYITLISNLGGIHANVFIYDKNTNELERFDGLGRDISDTYKSTEFDETIKPLFEAQTGSLFKKPVKYLTPLDYCPKFRVFQSKELDDIPGKDLRGNCAVWRLWYIHIRLANPHLKRKELVHLAAKKLQQTGSLYKFIKSYHAYIVNQASA